MKIEVIAIAEEILKGMIVNTNSSFISAELAKYGWKTSRHTVLPDEPHILKQGINEALERSDVVITTGGLGPTLDDITRSVAAEIFDSEFKYDEEIAKDLLNRFGASLSSIKDQATIPVKAYVLKNKVGTAPGFIFQDKGKILALMPGVPPEMQPMMSQELLPFLRKKYPEYNEKNLDFIHFSLLSENILDPLLRQLKKDYPMVEIGIYPGYGTLTVALQSHHAAHLAAVRHRLVQEFSLHEFPSHSGKIEEAVFDWMVENKKTISFAESCTGGLLSHKITSMSGASQFFLGSIVTYSNQMKMDLLGVSQKTLDCYGAVSAEVVQEMLQGLFAKTQSDFGIAVSGIAGPLGGSQDKPVGTIFVAIGQKGKKADVTMMHIKGNRQTILLSTTSRVLAGLYRKVKFGISAFENI
jgi:nicotinamide-nucleotide amidase